MRILALAVSLFLGTGAASAADIDAMLSTAMKAAFDELLPAFERANGHVVRPVYGPGGALLRRVAASEPADLFVTDLRTLDELQRQGKVAADRITLARTGIGI